MRALALLLLLTLGVWAEAPDLTLWDELWVQTSADYRAHCYQTYSWALRTLQTRASLAGPKDAQGRLVDRVYLSSGGRITEVTRPLAVVMDLDETVIDNSAYQIFLAKSGTRFNPESWNAFLTWQGQHPETGRAIPGAVEFIRAAEALGFTPIFISNRTLPYQDATSRVLDAIGVNVQSLEGRIWLDPGKAEDAQGAQRILAGLGMTADSAEGRKMLEGQARKERRRWEVRLRYHPIMYLGDDLGDFLSFVKDPQAPVEKVLQDREAIVDAHRENWGRDWFFLPNPMYGNWSPGLTLPASGLEKYLRDDGFTDFWRSLGK